MRLEYSLRLNSAVTLAGRAWQPTRLFAQGQSGALFSARRGLFLDVAGTEPALAPGQPVALMRDLSGNENHATQPNLSQRPILGRHPARGLINIHPSNTANLVSGSGWASNRMSVVASTLSTSGEPAAVLTATDAHPSGAFLRGGILTKDVGTYTLSAVVQGNGWFVLRPTVEANFSDAAVAWFNLGAGEKGAVALAGGADVFSAPSSTMTPVGDGYRVSVTFTLGASVGISDRFYLVDGDNSLAVTSGASARIEAPQLEAGAVATNYQPRASQYDVTKIGQKSLWYLALDGVDDWMQLAQPFTGDGPYIMAATRDWITGWPGPLTFGSVNGASLLNLAQGISLTASGSGNRVLFGATTGWPTVAAGQNRVDIVRVESASQAQAWRNDTAYPTSPDITGDIVQLAGINTLFRAAGGYGLGRFYGGVMASGPVADSDRTRLHRHLAKLGGSIA